MITVGLGLRLPATALRIKVTTLLRRYEFLLVHRDLRAAKPLALLYKLTCDPLDFLVVGLLILVVQGALKA